MTLARRERPGRTSFEADNGEGTSVLTSIAGNGQRSPSNVHVPGFLGRAVDRGPSKMEEGRRRGAGTLGWHPKANAGRRCRGWPSRAHGNECRSAEYGAIEAALVAPCDSLGCQPYDGRARLSASKEVLPLRSRIASVERLVHPPRCCVPRPLRFPRPLR